VKTKKQDISIRELFRQKLENAEIIPDASVNLKLMRKVAGKEFLRFNPARFNIYYLGGILVAGITAAVVLYSEKDHSEKLIPLNNSIEVVNPVTTVNAILSGTETVTAKSDSLNKKPGVSINNKSIKRPKDISARIPLQTSDLREKNSIPLTNAISTLRENTVVSGASPEKNVLQGRFKTDESLFDPSATEGCAPLKLRFYNKLASSDSCRWTFGDGGYSDKKNPDWIFDVEGEYKVILQVFGNDGLLATSSTVITVHPKPLARFEIIPEKAVLPDDEIRFLNYSVGAVKYNWEFGDGSSSEQFEPLHKYAKFGNYNLSLVVTSEYGCSDSLIVLNAFTGSEYYIDFPNAFIPNPEGPSGGIYSSKSDETAQIFHPVSEGVSDYQLKIFSKSGILIFESRDVNIGWDGYFKGQLSNPGVYIWKVRGNFRNGEPFTKMGDLTLLRN
jgi:PKD repeat protein